MNKYNHLTSAFFINIFSILFAVGLLTNVKFYDFPISNLSVLVGIFYSFSALVIVIATYVFKQQDVTTYTAEQLEVFIRPAKFYENLIVITSRIALFILIVASFLTGQWLLGIICLVSLFCFGFMYDTTDNIKKDVTKEIEKRLTK